MPLSDEQLLSFETPIEEAFVQLLKEVGILNAYESRSVSSAQTPWVEVMFVEGPVTGHYHAHQIAGDNTSQGRCSHDEWESRLEFTVVSNRATDAQSGRVHKQYLGKIRSLCRSFTLSMKWPTTAASQFYGLSNIKGNGTVNSFDDEKDLDYSVISFTVKNNIRPEAWAN